MRRKLPRFLFIAAALALARPAPAQSMRVKDLAAGKLLVAPRKSPDPSFARTVILLVQKDGDGALGLMLNRRTKVSISEALQDVKAAKQNSDPIYMGGPVELNGVLALFRSQAKPDDTRHVIADIFWASAREPLEKALAAGTGPAEFRIYLGYCGWGAGQLEREVELGGWFIFNADPALVFDTDPGSLWSRLIARTEERIALAGGKACITLARTKPPGFTVLR